jgi:hypothetical protein
MSAGLFFLLARRVCGGGLGAFRAAVPAFVQIEVRGATVLLDEADLSLLKGKALYMLGGKNGCQYIGCRGRDGKTDRLHRLILNAPTGREVDHINGNGLDNRRANLRLCLPRQNRWNMRKSIDRKCTSKFKGVYIMKGTGQITANISAQGERFFLGVFQSEEDAARAYDTAARRLHGRFARLNFPGPGEQAALVDPDTFHSSPIASEAQRDHV